MIEKLNYKNKLDVYNFVISNNDSCQDFYITFDKERHFLNDLKLVDKVLRTQQCYGLFEKELEAVMIVYRSEGFRPYVKLFAKKQSQYNKLLKFLNWHHNEELFVKVKKYNPAVYELKRNRFFVEGFRGKEILLKKLKDTRERPHGTNQFLFKD